MSPKPEAPSSPRIVVALDASEASTSALEEAAELAALTDAEILGIFVEDLNLFRLALLPAYEHIALPSGTSQPLDLHALEAHLVQGAARARQALARAVTSRGLRGAFRAVRGIVGEELASAAGEEDLLVLGWALGDAPRIRLGSVARAAADAGRRVLVVPQGSSLRLPVLVAYSQSPGSTTALQEGARLAMAVGTQLSVLLITEGEETDRLQERAASLLGTEGSIARFERLKVPRPRLRDVLQAGAGRLLVLEAERWSFGGSVELLKDMSDPVLLVRARPRGAPGMKRRWRAPALPHP